MEPNILPSKILESAIKAFASLPGIGEKTALRLVLYLLKQGNEEIKNFAQTFISLSENIMFCKICKNLSETEICNICASSSRDKSLICVVENIKNLIAIENTKQYKGLYHILGGIISPLDGIGPDDLYINELEERISKNRNTIKEVILALSATMEGDTTNYYIYKRLKKYNIAVSTIARGVSIGGDLEYVDELTLGRSIINRIPFENSITI